MWNLSELNIFLLLAVWYSVALADNREVPKIIPYKNSVERIMEHGYPVEEHRVVTEDGYILTIFRIPHSHSSSPPVPDHTVRPVVLIMHGLFCTSDIWLLNGPNDGLPFILADAGYDVWLGNARGNHYSRNHTTLSVHQPNFWNFSFHEIGYYDLAAMIDYTIATNGEQRHRSLHYVGHSQGVTTLLTLLSSRPAYNDMIRTANLLAPVAYLNHASSAVMRLFSPYFGKDNTYTRFVSEKELLPFNDFLLLFLINTCGTEGAFHTLCSRLLPSVPLFYESKRYNESIIGSLTEVFPGGISSNQLLHFFQLVKSGKFRQFDFGRLHNMRAYGQQTPPNYALENITAPLNLWFSDNDVYVAVIDGMRLFQRLTNKTLHHIEDPQWSHGEFLFSIIVKEIINEPLLQIMNEYESEITNK